MRVIRFDSFDRALERLPVEVVKQCEAQLLILEENWRDTRLHIKKLRGKKAEIFSFRIRRGYRGLFYFDTNNNIIVFDVDNRTDIYR